MNEIKDGKMYDKILEAKEKIDGVFIPDRTWNTIVERQKVIANVTNLLDDTANQHSGWFGGIYKKPVWLIILCGKCY